MQFISEKYLSLLTSSSRKYQEVSCSSSFYFLLCSKLWRTNCETRKWQLHEQVRATLCLHSPPPLQTVYSSFFFSLQMGHLMQRGTIDLASHPLLSTLYCPPFSGIISRRCGCFPVGERKEKEQVTNINVAGVVEKRSCKFIEDEENIHIVIQMADTDTKSLLPILTIFIHRKIHLEDTNSILWAHHYWFPRAIPNSLSLTF